MELSEDRWWEATARTGGTIRQDRQIGQSIASIARHGRRVGSVLYMASDLCGLADGFNPLQGLLASAFPGRPCCLSLAQRVLNDLLQTTRLSSDCIILAPCHANPLTPISRQKLVFLSWSSCVSPVELTDGKGGGGCEEPNHVTARKPGSLLSNRCSLPSPNSARVSQSRGLISAVLTNVFSWHTFPCSDVGVLSMLPMRML